MIRRSLAGLNRAASASLCRASDADVAAHGDERAAALQPVARVGLDRREDARDLAGAPESARSRLRWRRARPDDGCRRDGRDRAARSLGPMNRPSTPSTAAIASMFGSASRVSSCTMTHIPSLARARVVLHASVPVGAHRRRRRRGCLRADSASRPPRGALRRRSARTARGNSARRCRAAA